MNKERERERGGKKGAAKRFFSWPQRWFLASGSDRKLVPDVLLCWLTIIAAAFHSLPFRQSGNVSLGENLGLTRRESMDRWRNPPVTATTTWRGKKQEKRSPYGDWEDDIRRLLLTVLFCRWKKLLYSLSVWETVEWSSRGENGVKFDSTLLEKVAPLRTLYCS